jgi:hypothetical protein
MLQIEAAVKQLMNPLIHRMLFYLLGCNAVRFMYTSNITILHTLSNLIWQGSKEQLAEENRGSKKKKHEDEANKIIKCYTLYPPHNIKTGSYKKNKTGGACRIQVGNEKCVRAEWKARILSTCLFSNFLFKITFPPRKYKSVLLFHYRHTECSGIHYYMLLVNACLQHRILGFVNRTTETSSGTFASLWRQWPWRCFFEQPQRWKSLGAKTPHSLRDGSLVAVFWMIGSHKTTIQPWLGTKWLSLWWVLWRCTAVLTESKMI